MKLKLLFFPIVVVICLSLFIGFIWPDIGTIGDLKKEGKTNQSNLDAIKAKQAAIDNIGNELASNGETESLIKNYLPLDKVEERIVGGMNYLAGDANVSLLNLSMGSTSSTTATSSAANTLNIDGSPASKAPAGVQKTTVTLSIGGEYDKLRVFLDGVAHMPLYNSIKSLEITKPEAKDKDGKTIESSALLASVVVDFGYMNKATVDDASAAKFKPGLDDKMIEAVKKYISIKSMMSGVEVGNKGKSNPFVAN